jgi:hypothetical protein
LTWLCPCFDELRMWQRARGCRTPFEGLVASWRPAAARSRIPGLELERGWHMNAFAALASKVALAGAWARDMLVLGVTVPLDAEPHRSVPNAPLFNPTTGLPMLGGHNDVNGTPYGCLPTKCEKGLFSD